MANGQRTSPPATTGGNSQGAQMDNIYLRRRQELVSVNRTDLEDIREFDSSAQAFTASGIFLMGGGSWLGVEKVFEASSSELGFHMTPLLWVCALCVGVGIFLWLQGSKMASRKITRIERIFDETEEIRPTNSTSKPTGSAKSGSNRGV
jgi:hypothetical protein